MRAFLKSFVLCLCTALPAAADPLRVVADIAPVHSLVARVMDGAGVPVLILRKDASPHGYALRPSQAAALEAAHVVIHVGGGLTPWLDDALDTLAPGATGLSLIETGDTTTHSFREGITFGAHDHAHDHDGLDPHAWLDPENGRVWLGHIAETLASADPDNAALYRANAAAGRAQIDALTRRITSDLAPIHDHPFIVYHDAFQYFETRFDLPAVAAISLADDTAPGPARLAQIRDLIAGAGVICIFSEAQSNSGLIHTVTAGTNVKTAELDPIGATLIPGPQLYYSLLDAMAQTMAGCLHPN